MEFDPNYSQYPRPAQGSGGFGTSNRPYREPGVYFDYLSDAWTMITKNMVVYVLGTLLVMVITQVIQLPSSFLNNLIMYGNVMGQPPSGQFFPNFKPYMVPLLLLSSLIPIAISQVLYVGISLCALEEADTGATSINTLFSGFRSFVNVGAASLLYFLTVYIGFLICFIPSLFITGKLDVTPAVIVGFLLGLIPAAYLAGLFAFAPIIASQEGLGPIQAMAKSATMLKPFAVQFFAFLLLCATLGFFGVFACCIGILWTMPIMYIGMALHYRDFRGPGNQGYVAPTI